MIIREDSNYKRKPCLQVIEKRPVLLLVVEKESEKSAFKNDLFKWIPNTLGSIKWRGR